MGKQVRDTNAGKSISAYVVFDKSGRHVANVHAHFANSGGVSVDVWNIGDKVTKRTAQAMGYAFDDQDKITTHNGKATPHAGEYAYKVAGLQQGRAGGHGYDKFTACLSGLYIDGHAMTNHCGERMKRPKGRLWQDSDKARLARKGYTLSNWIGDSKAGVYGCEGVPEGSSGWRDAYRLEGLNYLGALGYRVVKAI